MLSKRKKSNFTGTFRSTAPRNSSSERMSRSETSHRYNLPSISLSIRTARRQQEQGERKQMIIESNTPENRTGNGYDNGKGNGHGYDHDHGNGNGDGSQTHE